MVELTLRQEGITAIGFMGKGEEDEIAMPCMKIDGIMMPLTDDEKLIDIWSDLGSALGCAVRVGGLEVGMYLLSERYISGV